ncbi:MAG: ParB/RepB/Spo0J family partition protein [Limnobacter sp.]|jgi:ParB family transcriptional regulator, chromosome partitioning protein|uniref:ParB/RepB/Spo0J family partition protein n=1 Tax=Limnobacter profundi TaxID=2732163 RepID=A0ABX6NAA3_9BURK|nr:MULTISPECIES: ParB/RepB/Spo0J family partition protein [unclassified Limnobacter]MAG79825.1 chromosome partitioning protein ParB [Sutterellaceae bacterium]MBA4316260.1 chromosome partitioning protein ParB [Alcaligenaceae bacterium]PZO17201.1 MAG: chromosome partitioning protein ParB [Betaproteobacteria bacterium]MAG81539.1 chromosome partitioning protein ParB [Sutterellaceae bacterium]MAG81658.1 chromosome partitioning protein ParB [Sutterellaceae bacterium]|tara:strand:+ start:2202 stop:3083 length:882 start_codon:yes stop_codon:yes gene_type:complete
MNAIKRTKGLGRGLEALLGPSGDDANKDMGEQVMTLPLGKLQAGKYQPRSRMDESSLMELAESIKSQGIMQPILVRPIGSGKYEIIAGERRFRASKLAGLEEVPVLVRAVPDESALAMALIENIQREDLNPLEEALGVQRLIREFNLTHEDAARAIGRSRSATSNMLRLLNLAEPVQTMLLAGDIEMGHARALLALTAAEQIACANEVVNKRLSVRETEKLVNDWASDGDRQAAKPKQTADVRRLEEGLADWLASAVQLKANANGKGSVTIKFNNLDELDGVLERIGFPKEEL